MTAEGNGHDIRAVIFDFGGVIMDMGWKEMAELERRHGLPDHAIRRSLYRIPEWDARQKGTCTQEVYMAAVERELERHAGRPVPECYAEWRALVRSLNTEVVELAKALRPRYTVALLSNADERLEAILHERYGIAHLFDPLIVSAKVGLAKPDPAIYTLAAERSGAPPECCVFIDDFRHNAEAASAVGMHGLTFTSSRALADDLRGLGVEW